MLWVIFSLASAFLLAFVDIFSKSFFRKKTLRPAQLNFSLSFFIALFTFIFFNFKLNLDISVISFFLILLKVFLLLCFNILYMSLLEKHDVSKVVPLNNLSPILIIMLSAIFLGESVTLLNLIGIFTIMFSTYYLEVIVEHYGHLNPHKKHLSYFKTFDYKFALKIFVMLFVVSSCAIADKFILRTVGVYTNVFYTYLFTTLALCGFLIFTKSLLNTFKIMIKTPMFAIQGAFSLFSSIFILSALAMPESLASLVIPLRRTSSLMAASIGGFLFHEKHLKQKLISICIMIVGILLVAI